MTIEIREKTFHPPLRHVYPVSLSFLPFCSSKSILPLSPSFHNRRSARGRRRIVGDDYVKLPARDVSISVPRRIDTDAGNKNKHGNVINGIKYPFPSANFSFPFPWQEIYFIQ